MPTEDRSGSGVALLVLRWSGFVRPGHPPQVIRLRPYSVGVNRDSRILFGLLLFNGISAVGGGFALMTGLIPRQAPWIVHTDFSGLYFPGVILMAIVGGSSLLAALAMVKRTSGWQLCSLLTGLVMLFWIVGEIASIRAFHFLQVIYFVTGVLVIWFTPRGSPSASSPPTE